MPLSFAGIGEENTIKKICGTPEVKKHLAGLGFAAGGKIRIITRLGDNFIVNVRDARIAISSETAGKIIV